jgi:hypothetical protein
MDTNRLRDVLPSNARGSGLSTRFRLPMGRVGLLIGLAVPVALLFVVSQFLGYALANVKDTQVGIQLHAGQPFRVVGPGVYTDLQPFAEMKTISIAGLPFEVQDPEVLTKDKQRIGVAVTGTVHRPGVDKSDVLLRNWAQYRTFYTDDMALVGPDKKAGLMRSIGQQAMKVCVGDLTFDDAVIGSARDVLRECIDKQLDALAVGYGLEVRNVVVHDVILSKEVQGQLDAITKARFDTQLAHQREEQAKAEAERELAVQQGQIRVEQGKIQEKARQDALTAELNQKRFAAERAVIETEKANQEFTAQRDLEIAKVQRLVAEENARSTLAPEQAKAAMHEASPRYTDLRRTEAMAGAYKQTDKFVVLPDGTNPYVFIGGEKPPVVTASQP